MAPKKVISLKPYTFNVTERGRGQSDLLNKEHGMLAPPPGHYEAKMDMVKPRVSRYGFMTLQDTPNAPTYKAESKMKGAARSGAKSASPTRRAATAEPVLQKQRKGLPMSPRSAFFMLRDKAPPSARERASASPTRSVSAFGVRGEVRGDERRPASPDALLTRDLEESTADSKTKRSMIESAPDQTGLTANLSTASLRRSREMHEPSDFFLPKDDLIRPHTTADFSRGLARATPEGRLTTTGRQGPTSTPSPDVWYESMVSVPAVKLMHVSGPDLERTGGRAERQDQLKRLGYRIPEELAEAPEYPKAMAPLDWSAQDGWFNATKNVGRKAFVELQRTTAIGRFSHATNAERESQMRIQYRNSKKGTLDNTICIKDSNPLLHHVEGFRMQRAWSSHDNFPIGRQSTCQTEDYRISHRLVQMRSQGAPPLRKGLPRRAMTADPNTGRPIQPSLDVIYERNFPADKRGRAPDFNTTLGRPPDGSEITTSAGGLTGMHYWSNVDPLHNVPSIIRRHKLPDMHVQMGREANIPGDTSRVKQAMALALDSEIREPLSEAGKTAMKNRAVVWTPKDNVIDVHTMTPHLVSNARARDTERQKKKPPLARDLEYSPNWDLVHVRSSSALMGKISEKKTANQTML